MFKLCHLQYIVVPQKPVAQTRLLDVPFVYSTNNTTLYKRLEHLYKTITSVNFVL